MVDLGWLPALIDCDWNEYAKTIERAYAIFWADFGNPKTRPTFQKRRLGLKRHPETDGKSATFWHFVTEGADEATRGPERERLERIAWPRAMIVESARDPSRVYVWEARRPGAKRWVICLEDFRYVVVLDDRKEFVLPWTAYPVNEEHRRNKLKRERDTWLAGRKG